MRILVIEDSPPTRDLLRRSLEQEGHAVTLASRSSTGLRLATEETFDLILLDVMLPDGSGIELCRQLRASRVATPVLILTARGEVGDRIEGLDSGADDYLKKPFALAELYARIRALGRRGGAPTSQVRAGTTSIDFAARRLERAGEEVPLTAREWAVLELLAARAGRVVTRQELLDSAWHETTQAASESLDVILSRLRRKLGPAETAPCHIRTVRGVGYSFEVEVG